MFRFLIFLGLFATMGASSALAAMTEYPKVRLRSLDKITARTMTFDARVGTTIKFGSIYIKILSCQKPDLQERNDAASFLQIWEITPDDVSKWIFSGWMFAASPALSAMDHPIYDVWVVDCLDDGSMKKAEEEKARAAATAPAPTIDDVVNKAATSSSPDPAPADALPNTPAESAPTISPFE